MALLEPAGRGVRLTPQARILVERIEVIPERLEEAEADLRAPRWRRCAAPCGSPLQSVLFALVPSVLVRLAGRHPPLRVEIAQRIKVAAQSQALGEAGPDSVAAP